jgi:hypothetical protein
MQNRHEKDIEMIDYGKILTKYIEHVGECEGVDFGAPAGLTAEEEIAWIECSKIGGVQPEYEIRLDQRIADLRAAIADREPVAVSTKITDHVRGTSRFLYFRAGNLWYQTDTGIEFPVPVNDTDGATFEAEHKSLTLMRWIRKHMALIVTE